MFTYNRPASSSLISESPDTSAVTAWLRSRFPQAIRVVKLTVSFVVAAGGEAKLTRILAVCVASAGQWMWAAFAVPVSPVVHVRLYDSVLLGSSCAEKSPVAVDVVAGTSLAPLSVAR